MKDYIEVEGVRYVREDRQVSGNSKGGPEAVLSLDTEHVHSYWDEDTVKCPNCHESSGLHLNEIWLENAAGHKLFASATGEGKESRINVSLTNDGESDGRRYTLTIGGNCEHCPTTTFKFRFKQHKGQTYFTQVIEPASE